MPWFDLKKTEIRIKDGFNKTGAVNNSGGYTTTATTMTVDGITGVVPVGILFTIAGNDTEYKITAKTDTLGNTTSITFTPGLAANASDNAVITFLPRRLVIKIGEGNLNYSEKRNIEYKRNRGILDQTRLGDEEPLDVSFDFWYEFLKASTGGTPTIEDVLKKRGEAADWLSSDLDDPCQPYSVDIEYIYTPECSTQEKEKVELKKFRFESLAHDLKAGNIQCSGKCNVTEPTVTRLAA